MHDQKMILPNKNSPLFQQNNNDKKIKEFISTINSLNFSIKALYRDFNENIDKECYYINILESKIDKSNPSIIEAINFLKIYIDLDKKAINDFFEEAKTIFKKMKVMFNELKQLINNNNQYHYINNIFPQQITSNNYNINNNNNLSKKFDNIKNDSEIMAPENNKRLKTITPIKLAASKNLNNSLNLHSSFKKNKSEIPEKDKEIKYLKNKLIILSNQKKASDKMLQELSKNYEELKNKYSNLEKICYDFKSADRRNSNYEEEFDLKKITRGVKEKNLSQDMNIDNPGLLAMKEKFGELRNKYNTLVDLVKNLLLTVNKNKINEQLFDDIIKIIFGKK